MNLDGKPGALSDSWLAVVGNELERPYMRALKEFLRSEKLAGMQVFPPGPQMFNALNHTPFEQVKVVILGQDPYHGPGQAHGLSFSVPTGVKQPPSLLNILKEIQADVGAPATLDGNLLPWAEQGVLLLNAVLSVQAGLPGSHQGKGWELFTDAVVAALNEKRENLVFLLWGSYAQKKGRLIDRSRHLVLTAPHPSPLSVYRGFFGCRHFSRANEYLRSVGKTPINWAL